MTQSRADRRGVGVAGVLCILFVASGVRAENVFDDGWRPAQRPPDVRQAPTLDEVSGAPPAAAGPAKRLPVPGSAELAASRQTLRELYASELRDTSSVARRTLARKLVESARGTADNAADRFALYEGAYRAATAASAVPLCVEAIDALAREYAVDGLWLKADAICRMNTKGLSDTDAAALARCGFAVVDELLAAEDFANAGRVTTAIEGVASKDLDLKRGLQQRKTEAAAARAARDRATAAMKTLAANPADPRANSEAGWYLCARGREWSRGLPMLAKGEKKELRSLAERDLVGAESGAESVALADAWWEVAQRKGVADGEQASVRAHAARWYRRAQAGATGLLAMKIEQRLAEAGARAGEGVLTWRVLLIIKSKGAVRTAGAACDYELPAAEVEAVRRAFAEYTPAIVKRLSRGRLAWAPEVVVSPVRLSTVTPLRDGTWVSPADVAGELDQHVTPGSFDCVFVYWKDSDDRTGASLRGGFGWSIGPSAGAKGCGYTCVNHMATNLWTPESETTEVFLHEWLHQVEAFYQSKGVRLPRGGLHGNSNYGFEHEASGWKKWYEAFINAELKEPDGAFVGLGEAAWKLGTIRAAGGARPTAVGAGNGGGGGGDARAQARNLLADASFENAGGQTWRLTSWRRQEANRVVSLDRRRVHEGKASLSLTTDVADDVAVGQKVRVKPNTQYVLSGWIKTEDVRIVEAGGEFGASLGVMGTWEANRSFTGTRDWARVSVEFNTGNRDTVEVAARLGHNGSTATGRAWFDDLELVER